jgi:serine/threonine-protein kinase
MPVDPSAQTEAERPGAAVGAALSAGATLGKYRLEHVLGAGGMGVVWAAIDPDLERAVAIKVLRASDGSEVQRTRLLREARAMARLKHPNVLTVYEVGTANGVDYIAMELVEGDNLGAWFSQSPPRDQVIAALLAAGRGLAAAHEAGIVHRDFKPENVLRDRKGHVYVTDFGLAFGQVE